VLRALFKEVEQDYRMSQPSIGGSRRNSVNETDRAYIAIANIGVSVVCTDPEMRLGTSEAIQKFSARQTNPEANIRVFWGSPGAIANGKKLFDSGCLWQLFFNEQGYQFQFASPIFGKAPYKVALFSPDFTSGEIYLRRNCNDGQWIYPLEYPLDELLLINLLARGRGVEVHAAGLVDAQGNGHLFLGQSGAGKTTISRLWQGEDGVEILSDDRIILRNEGGQFWMYGTPWHGEGLFASPSRALLTRMYFLRHARCNALIPQRTAEAAARIFACSFPTFFSSEGLGFTLELLHEIAETVPCYELAFLPDETAVEFLTHTLPINEPSHHGR
jgi:hypothetical protein